MSNKTFKTKSTVAMAGVLAAALVAAAMYSPSFAFAQENKMSADERPLKTAFKVARGAGIATDTETGEDLRSAFRVLLQRGNETGEHDAVRGNLIISVDGERVRYALAPETWAITVAEDGRTFEASGAVQDAEGTEYRVSLDGYFGMHTRLGNSWSVEGTMEGGDARYELHYVAFSHPALRALADVQ